jgi:hypothetical protein
MNYEQKKIDKTALVRRDLPFYPAFDQKRVDLPLHALSPTLVYLFKFNYVINLSGLKIKVV